jgi:hypothetical protein
MKGGETHVSGMPFRLDVVETGEQWVVTCTTPHGKAVSRIPAPFVGPLHVPVKTRCAQWITAADRGDQRSDRRSSRWHSEPHSDTTTIGCAQANNAMPMRGVSQMAKDSDPLISALAMALFVSYLSARPDPTKAEVEIAIGHAIRAYGGTCGCAGEVAAAYGEHPEIAAPRMRWARDVIWLHLVEHLDKSRDTAALPGSLATTARREDCRALREARRSQTVGYVLDIENIPKQQGGIAGNELLHRRAERQTRAHAGARTGTLEGERRMRPNKS